MLQYFALLHACVHPAAFCCWTDLRLVQLGTGVAWARVERKLRPAREKQRTE